MIIGKKIIIVLLLIGCSLFSTQIPQKKLNILFVVSYFPAPSQPYILSLITRLIDKGHNVSVFAFQKNDVKANAAIMHYGLNKKVIYKNFPITLSNIDIVFCQSATMANSLINKPEIDKWLKNRKLVVCLRGHDISGNKVRDNPEIYRRLFQRGDLFLPVCNYFKKLLIRYGCNRNKIVVYHSAIDCDYFFFKKKQPIDPYGTIHIISVARLVKKKGLSFALQAFARVAKKYKNMRFTIVGDGRERQFLERLCQRLKISRKVTFFGWASQHEVLALLYRSHIFLLPSITTITGDEEGIANSLKEAMAMGVIAIGTFHAGTPELIENGVSGFLVPQRNSVALARKIEYIIRNSQIWRPMIVAARQKIKQDFEIRKCVRQLEELFYELLDSELSPL